MDHLREVASHRDEAVNALINRLRDMRRLFETQSTKYKLSRNPFASNRLRVLFAEFSAMLAEYNATVQRHHAIAQQLELVQERIRAYPAEADVTRADCAAIEEHLIADVQRQAQLVEHGDRLVDEAYRLLAPDVPPWHSRNKRHQQGPSASPQVAAVVVAGPQRMSTTEGRKRRQVERSAERRR
ncbi:hypothetical protein AAVH_34116 [Aphelenchoides avenae]|nr:hypothetical protein AAVH_34116 [Aphelenchus avenae]